ncbi:MAG: bifunctional [glutamate--ammonia ligase]-adenylyl-L-tyrosine phosphorylase/[glutamate--ammonia-ligase] adenylyltransferase [Rhodocyclaceae bacterium]
MNVPPDPIRLLDRAARLSRYLGRLFEARPTLRDEVAAGLTAPLGRAAMEVLLGTQPLAEDALKPSLRRLRSRVFAHVAARDLGGLADLAEVTETMTLLAEVSVNAALATLRAAMVARHGEPLDAKGRPLDLIVIGMGKLGGRELNVSSDIDLIFIYGEDGETAGGGTAKVLENFEFLSRLGRKLIDALADITADGQVFRVDMRLRPNGESGPLVCSLDMLENYLVTQGREWERYAWIKGRPLNDRCDPERLAELAAIVRPFVFRKYLDFGAVNAMRDLHAQIRREVSRRDMADHVKLGPGGIREIEFIAQVFQLIRGGRDAALQVRPTLQVLRGLGERGILDGTAVTALCAAYDFLRRLEHRLQYLEDQQTHCLPARPEDQILIAEAMGYATYGELMGALDGHRDRVSYHFEAVFADPGRDGHSLAPVWNGAHDGDATAVELARLGFQDADGAASRLAAMRAARRYQEMPTQIRSRFDALIPRVMQAAGATANPDGTLARILDLLDAISRRGAYLALLQQYPQALDKVAQMMSASSWAAAYLTRHPLLLDELLDARLLDAPPEAAAFRAQLSAALDEEEPDTERQMDLMREAHHAQVFRLLVKDLAGLLTVERHADYLSELADIVLDLTIRYTWRKLRQRHREEPRFAIISYGKLGGKELGYASDLDLVFLFDDDALEAPDTYARLGHRIVTWLSSRTGAGILFETDLRLRPSGEAGLLVTSLAAFDKYQMESAWVWEHQALTRARFSAGDRAIGERFEERRIAVLCKQRNLEELRREVLAMRRRMADAHANKSTLFDLKHDRGGLIDVEFIVQYLVLGYAHRFHRLTANLGNIALLGIAGELGLIDAALAQQVRDAYREYRRLQHGLRLNDAQFSRVDPASVAEQRAAAVALWESVFGGDETAPALSA